MINLTWLELFVLYLYYLQGEFIGHDGQIRINEILKIGHKPLCRQIADRIHEQIARGKLRPDDALPTELALQTEFGVSWVAVRQALRQLVEQQILEDTQGSGVYAREEWVNRDIFQLTSFGEKPSGRHVDTHSGILTLEVIPANNFLQQQLQITPQGRVWHVKRVRYRKQKPMALGEIWTPLASLLDLTWQVMENLKYHFVEEVKKTVIDRSEQEITPLIPTEEMSRLLNISQTKPILEKVSHGYLVDGRMFEYSHNAFNIDDYKFTLTAQRKSS